MTAQNKPRYAVPKRDPLPWIAPNSIHSDVLIILDFDGVLHPLGSDAVTFERLSALSQAIDQAETQSQSSIGVALSTSWRFHDWTEICYRLDLASPGFSRRLEGRCGCRAADTEPAGRRQVEILDYLNHRPHPCKAVVALDDQAILFGGPWSAAAPLELLLCAPHVGFDHNQAEQLIQHIAG